MFLLINKMYDISNIVLEFEAALVSKMELVNNITNWVVDTRTIREICSCKEFFLIVRDIFYVNLLIL